MFFFFLQIYLVIIFIRVFDEEKNYSTGYDRGRLWLIVLSIFLSKSQYFWSIRKITDFVNSLFGKIFNCYKAVNAFFFFFGWKKNDKSNYSEARIGKRVALTRSILQRFIWRRWSETTIKINCSNNGDLVADESAYRSKKRRSRHHVIEDRRKILRSSMKPFFDISILRTNFYVVYLIRTCSSLRDRCRVGIKITFSSFTYIYSIVRVEKLQVFSNLNC